MTTVWVSKKVYKDLVSKNMKSEVSFDGKVKYWIHLSEDTPIILKMDLGWKIWLKEMR